MSREAAAKACERLPDTLSVFGEREIDTAFACAAAIRALPALPDPARLEAEVERLREDKRADAQMIRHYEEAFKRLGWTVEDDPDQICKARAEEISQLEDALDAAEAEIATLKEEVERLTRELAATVAERDRAQTAVQQIATRFAAAEAERNLADTALQQVSIRLGGTDEWASQESMCADVLRLAEAVEAARFLDQAALAAHADALATLKAENARYRARLEIDIAWALSQGDDELKRIPFPEGCEAYDGIACRDETIKQQDERIATLKARVAELDWQPIETLPASKLAHLGRWITDFTTPFWVTTTGHWYEWKGVREWVLRGGKDALYYDPQPTHWREITPPPLTTQEPPHDAR